MKKLNKNRAFCLLSDVCILVILNLREKENFLKYLENQRKQG